MVIEVQNNGMGDIPATVLSSTVETTVSRQLQSMTQNVASGVMPPWSQADAESVLTQVAKFQCGINGSADPGCADNGVAVAKKYAQQYAQFSSSTSKSAVVAPPEVQVSIKTPAGWGANPAPPAPVSIPVSLNPVLSAMGPAPSTPAITGTPGPTPVTGDNSLLLWAAAGIALFFFMKGK